MRKVLSDLLLREQAFQGGPLGEFGCEKFTKELALAVSLFANSYCSCLPDVEAVVGPQMRVRVALVTPALKLC